MKEMYWATVVDNNDTELKVGRVKIKIPYLHDETDDDLLPWAKQMTAFSGGSSDYGSSYIPEINSLVWVIFENEEDLLKPFYIADVHLNNMNPHQLFNDNVASKITGFASVYPDVKYQYYKNGICIGASSNSDSPEIFTYHPSGTYISIDKDGRVNIKSGSATLESTILGETLKTKLEALIDAINALTVNTAVGPSSVPNNASTFTQIKNGLSAILSTQIKNN